MPDFVTLFPLIVLGIFAFFGWRFLRSGSVVGALLGGRITATTGEVVLSSSALGSRVIKVHVLDPRSGEPPCVALAITSKAVLGASVVPVKLSRDDARKLADLLIAAAKG